MGDHLHIVFIFLNISFAHAHVPAVFMITFIYAKQLNQYPLIVTKVTDFQPTPASDSI